ncbi:MAG: Uma2 family endonuclease [Acetobacteraceae bacterium]|nr:Uma2 family endonuclease [Acetobacteraceae bacterium]
MSDAAQRRKLNADEFIQWAMDQPKRYELVAGEAVAMAPERVAHAEAKFMVARRLAEAVEAAGLRCQVFTDGMAVQIDEFTVYEPDALVRCGERLPGDAVKVLDPLIVVEVVSPSSRGRDAGAKFADYFRLPTLRHYLILSTETRTVVHHERDDAGVITSRVVSDGAITLDPPGMSVSLSPRPDS